MCSSGWSQTHGNLPTSVPQVLKLYAAPLHQAPYLIFIYQIVSDSKAKFVTALGPYEVEICIGFLGLLSPKASGLRDRNVTIHS